MRLGVIVCKFHLRVLSFLLFFLHIDIKSNVIILDVMNVLINLGVHAR